MYLEGVDIGIPIMNTLYCFEPLNDILKQKEKTKRGENTFLQKYMRNCLMKFSLMRDIWV